MDLINRSDLNECSRYLWGGGNANPTDASQSPSNIGTFGKFSPNIPFLFSIGVFLDDRPAHHLNRVLFSCRPQKRWRSEAIPAFKNCTLFVNMIVNGERREVPGQPEGERWRV